MKTRNSQSGFSLIEMMISILILMIVMGAVFSQIDQVQKRARIEEDKVDQFQTAREFMDQMVRDVHQAGFPNPKMYDTGVMGTYPVDYTAFAKNQKNAVGMVYASPTHVRFEGDIDGDGQVDAVAYYVETDTTKPENQSCPCIRRSVVLKNGIDAPQDQVEDFRTQVENVTLDTKQPIFTFYKQDGTILNVGTGLYKQTFDPYDLDDVNLIWTVQIRMTVTSASIDLQTKKKPTIVMNASAQVKN